MENSTSQKLKLGIFVVLGVVLLYTAVYLIGNEQNLFGRTFKIYAHFDNVSGLKLGDNVRYAGINVGAVKQLKMVNDTTVRVEMQMQGDMQKKIRSDALATIANHGF
ncbi:MlaD family protein [Pricia sp. S334]|uniref:MlaD family protein n=1 Tax=Pricia mediterranea TaxID=3076079 RepID=A0ABU3L2F5_9FLAO|nr:MlaD family protein [Pricia sp. S334]MDT7827364.1 MlaD family protein [Pricia sp. S334]